MTRKKGISRMTADDDGKYVISKLSIRLEMKAGTERAAAGPPQGRVLDEHSNKRCPPSTNNSNRRGLSQHLSPASVYNNQQPNTPKPPVSESPNHEILSDVRSSCDVSSESPSHKTPSESSSSTPSWDVRSSITALWTTGNAESPNHETPSDFSSSTPSWDVRSSITVLRATGNAESLNHETSSDYSSSTPSWDVSSSITALPTTDNADCSSITALRTSANIPCSTDLMRELLLRTSPPSSPLNTSTDRESPMLLQPETRPITQEQLVNEVKGIYAGLVMVEKKCVEIDQQQASTTNKLSNEQWQALIALHRTLLHEHHDFFLASQHPSSSPALRRLATKYAMPARMWRHGMHSFLELLRHRLPDSLEQMLSFVYLAYSMMTLLMESVPSFEETWIECLGDLARYRMAIEKADLRDRETWSGVARMWYNKAADKSPNVGRIQHHLGVLAQPNIVQQLFYYSKALVSVVPFQDARESVMLLFNPFLEGSEIVSQRDSLVEAALVKANGILFTHGSISEYVSLMKQFVAVLDNYISCVTAKFRVQGPEIASSLCAATFDFGTAEAFLTQCFRNQESLKKAQLLAHQSSNGQEPSLEEDLSVKRASMHAYWAPLNDTSKAVKANPHPMQDPNTRDAVFSGSDDAAAYACKSMGEATSVVARRIGDKNILPYMHVILAYIWSLAFVPGALTYIEGFIPWLDVTTFLNTLGRSGVVESRFEGIEFPQHISGTGRQLPEDFDIRGLIWAQHYFPADFFDGQLVDEDERTLELPSHAALRAERCLWLGAQIATINRWISYDSKVKQFSTTHFATRAHRP